MSGRSKDGGPVGETEGEKKTVSAPRQSEVDKMTGLISTNVLILAGGESCLSKICVSSSTNPTSVEIQPQKEPVTWTLNDMVVSTELEKVSFC